MTPFKIHFTNLLLIVSIIQYIRPGLLDRIESNYNHYAVKKYAKAKATPEIEQFIRSIAQEMNITKTFDIYIMNSHAIAEVGIANAFVVGKSLFISPHFLEVLSTQEKRFLMGHELTHLEKEHIPKRILLSSFMLGIYAIPCGIMMYKNTQRNKIDAASIIRAFATYSFGGILLATFFKYVRNQELEADQESAQRLNEYEGGISCMNTFDIYHTKDNVRSWWQRLFSTHPTHEERKKQLISLQNQK